MHKRFYAVGLFVFLFVVLLAQNPFTSRASQASSTTSPAIVQRQHTSSPWTGVTTDWSNVRSGPGTGFDVVTTYPPATTVTVYATVSDETVWNGISNWYRISSSSSSPLYIYAGLVDAGNSTATTNSAPITPSAQGKEILVSISKQWMYVYDNGSQVYDSPITTGRPELPTPTGTYYVIEKLHPTTFYSPWPYGSPYWYPPSHINYALEWKADGYFLHDSWWRTVYGPGANVWHTDPAYGQETGTHGCVTMPLAAAAWLYNWAPIGTMVKIQW